MEIKNVENEGLSSMQGRYPLGTESSICTEPPGNSVPQSYKNNNVNSKKKKKNEFEAVYFCEKGSPFLNIWSRLQ